MNSLEQRIDEIERRNQKVEADKAWEISWLRRGLVALTTYITVAIFLIAIHKDQPFINALVPTIGYLLSTLALYNVKKAWVKRH
jgi:hypothetical protein